MSGFRGTSNHNLDQKGRVFVPKRIQQCLTADGEGARTVVLSPGIDNSINLFTEEGWQLAMRRLQMQPFAGDQALSMQRFVIGNTFDVQLDASNRLLIPERLREYAKLSEDKCEVALVGVEHRLEIWNAAAWQTFESAAAQDFDASARAWALGGDASPAPAGGGA